MYVASVALALLALLLALAFRRSFGRRSAALTGALVGGGVAAMIGDTAYAAGQIRDTLVVAAVLVVIGAAVLVVRRG